MKTTLFPLVLAVVLSGCTNPSGAKIEPVALGPSATGTGAAAPATANNATANAPGAAGQDNITITARDRNAFVTLRPKGTLTVDLEANHSAGYSWKLARPVDPAILTVTPPTNEPAPVALAPGLSKPVPEQWIFKSVGPGTAKVRMIYTRPTASLDEATSFEFTVNAE